MGKNFRPRCCWRDATEKREKDQHTGQERFETILRKSLRDAHQSQGTVLRRLNRREYQNTLNDIFGTSLDLESMLPEDSRFHEFDNVGEALSLSMTHMQRYMEAAGMVFDAAVATTVSAPKADIIDCFFRESEVDRELGKTVKRLEDGAWLGIHPMAYHEDIYAKVAHANLENIESV